MPTAPPPEPRTAATVTDLTQQGGDDAPEGDDVDERDPASDDEETDDDE